MNDYETIEVFEQAATFDKKFSLAIDPYLLMKIINHSRLEFDEEFDDAEDPKRFAVQVVISVKELPMPKKQEKSND